MYVAAVGKRGEELMRSNEVTLKTSVQGGCGGGCVGGGGGGGESGCGEGGCGGGGTGGGYGVWWWWWVWW